MTLFEQIVKESKALLSELTRSQGRDQDIIDAVNNVLRVRIGYDDEQGGRKGKNLRYIIPVAYGTSSAGNPVVRAYQTMGSSKRGLEDNKWKFFRVDRIYSWDSGKKASETDIKEMLSAIPKFNDESDDKSLSVVYARSPLTKAGGPLNQVPTIDSGPVTKADVGEPVTAKATTPAKTSGQNAPSQAKTGEKNIDITPSQSYFKNKIEAPETEPITKRQISEPEEEQPQQNVQEPAEAPKDNLQPVRTDTPVTKDQIEDTEDIMNDKEVKAMNDFAKRMNNVENGEEEENEEEA